MLVGRNLLEVESSLVQAFVLVSSNYDKHEHLYILSALLGELLGVVVYALEIKEVSPTANQENLIRKPIVQIYHLTLVCTSPILDGLLNPNLISCRSR